jgi:hypothetical protein
LRERATIGIYRTKYRILSSSINTMVKNRKISLFIDEADFIVRQPECTSVLKFETRTTILNRLLVGFVTRLCERAPTISIVLTNIYRLQENLVEVISVLRFTTLMFS